MTETAPTQTRRALADFLGSWRIDRFISDHLTGRTSRFQGEAEILLSEDVAKYRESGTLQFDGQTLRAERKYLWRQEDTQIDVSFEDGRPFHRFDPVTGGAGTPHLCGSDLYKVSYVLGEFPNWSTGWAVTGPRKHYLMQSHYSPVS